MSRQIVKELAGLALFVIPLAAALSLAARVARRTEGRQPFRYLVAFWCFCIYAVLVATLTLAPPPMSMSNGAFGTNLIPIIHSVRCFVPDPGQPSTTDFCLRTIVGNVAIFLPFGILLPIVFVPMVSFKRVLTAALITSLSIEVLQFAGRWVGSFRWSDIDDVLFNLLGAMAGYCAWWLSTNAGRPRRGNV